MQNYFELLGLAVACEVDMKVLQDNYRLLQSRLHPDQFVNAEPARRMQAVQQSSLLNDAYDTLKDPQRRAGHILALFGVDLSEQGGHDLDGAFLLAQMELREELETVRASRNIQALDALRNKGEVEQRTVWQDLTGNIAKGDYLAGKAGFHKLQFLNKLLEEINEAENALLDY